MWTERRPSKHLEDAFSVLRFRRRGVVSFRKFVILNVRRRSNASGQHLEEAVTQPMRVVHR